MRSAKQVYGSTVRMSEEAFAWTVGVDWGSEKHLVCILDQQGSVAGERSFPHGRQTVYHWARSAAQHDPKTKARDAALRQRGHSHGRALRGVGD